MRVPCCTCACHGQSSSPCTLYPREQAGAPAEQAAEGSSGASPAAAPARRASAAAAAADAEAKAADKRTVMWAEVPAPTAAQTPPSPGARPLSAARPRDAPTSAAACEPAAAKRPRHSFGSRVGPSASITLPAEPVEPGVCSIRAGWAAPRALATRAHAAGCLYWLARHPGGGGAVAAAGAVPRLAALMRDAAAGAAPPPALPPELGVAALAEGLGLLQLPACPRNMVMLLPSASSLII